MDRRNARNKKEEKRGPRKNWQTMTQIFIHWNGAHWVARVEGRTLSGAEEFVKTALYKMNYTPIFVQS